MSSPLETKTSLRRQALSRRDGLPEDWRIEMAMRVASAAPDFPLEPGTVVSGFWPMRSEMDIRPLMAALRDRGAQLCLPAILDKETIVFRELIRGAPMIDMGFGTLGPGKEAAVLDPAIMLVPLAAFDVGGNRIGYGGGYYDRAIARLRARGFDPKLIGIAFNCQEVPAVPIEEHDIPLHAIWTESGLRPVVFG